MMRHPNSARDLRSTARQRVTVIVAFISCCCMSALACGEFVMTLQGVAGSPIVSFSLRGSGVAKDRFGTGILGVVFDLDDGYDPFAPSSVGTFEVQSGGASWTNVTTGVTVAIDKLTLQDSTFLGVVDRFGVTTATSYNQGLGDYFEWFGRGTIDLSERGLSFVDLVQGAGTGQANLPGIPGNFGGRLIIVPEPSSLILFSYCVFYYCARSSYRRQRSM